MVPCGSALLRSTPQCIIQVIPTRIGSFGLQFGLQLFHLWIPGVFHAFNEILEKLAPTVRPADALGSSGVSPAFRQRFKCRLDFLSLTCRFVSPIVIGVRIKLPTARGERSGLAKLGLTLGLK